MSVLDERKTVRCHRIPADLCRVTTAKDTGVFLLNLSDFLIMWWQHQDFLAKKKMDSKQKLMCPNSNLQKQITLPKVTAAIGKLICACPSASDSKPLLKP